MIEPKVFSVGQINRYIKNLLENDFILNSLLVQGEISNFKAHSSGHWYFTLKDAQGAIACVMFQQDAAQVPFLPENGMQVILYGHVSLYERTGQYQLYGEFLEPVGMGALQLAFEQMKEKLAAEGLFDADYKREIPENVGCIAVITSPTGAAVRDIIQIAKRRDPRVKLAIFPTLVQGEAAAVDIVKSLKAANSWGKADVIILGRARAIFASELPVISAVGHETDFTIADFVSDLRAPTPSAAAELATTRLADKKEDARALAERLERNLQAVLTVSKRRLEFLKERPVLKRPLELMQKKERMLAEQERLLYKETAGQLQRLSRGLLAAEGRLAAVSPFSVMNRGYAMLMDEGGTPLTTAQAAKIGQAVRIRMKDGILQAEVTGKAVFADGEKETNL